MRVATGRFVVPSLCDRTQQRGPARSTGAFEQDRWLFVEPVDERIGPPLHVFRSSESRTLPSSNRSSGIASASGSSAASCSIQVRSRRVSVSESGPFRSPRCGAEPPSPMVRWRMPIHEISEGGDEDRVRDAIDRLPLALTGEAVRSPKLAARKNSRSGKIEGR